jgi:bacterioferritin-associated ferredoxin
MYRFFGDCDAAGFLRQDKSRGDHENGMGFAFALSAHPFTPIRCADRYFGAPMIVCSCNVLSDTKIRASINGGTCPKTTGALYKCMGCSPNCGRCFSTVQTIIIQALAESNMLDPDMCDLAGDNGATSFAS